MKIKGSIKILIVVIISVSLFIIYSSNIYTIKESREDFSSCNEEIISFELTPKLLASFMSKLHNKYDTPNYTSKNFEYSMSYNIKCKKGKEIINYQIDVRGFDIYVYSDKNNIKNKIKSISIILNIINSGKKDFSYIGYYLDGEIKIKLGCKDKKIYYDEFDMTNKELDIINKDKHFYDGV